MSATSEKQIVGKLTGAAVTLAVMGIIGMLGVWEAHGRTAQKVQMIEKNHGDRFTGDDAEALETGLHAEIEALEWRIRASENEITGMREHIKCQH